MMWFGGLHLRIGRGHRAIAPETTKFGLALCLGGASIGAIGLVGWLMGIAPLATLVPGRPPVLPNTAFALLLLGIAGVLLHPRESGRLRQFLAESIAVVVLLIGLVIIAEYVLSLQIGLDQAFVHGRAGQYPARASPPTALGLVFLASAILFFDSRPNKRTRPSEWLIIGAGLIATTALLGYLYGARPLYSLTSAPIMSVAVPMAAIRLFRVGGGLLMMGVAVPTALSGFMISLGLLLERPDTGIVRVFTAPGPGGVLLRRLTSLAVLAPVVFGFIAARVSGVEDAALAFAALTVMTIVVSLFLLAFTAMRLNRAHDKLELARVRNRELVEQASDGIFMADLDGRLLDVNDAGCRLVGYSREEILTKVILDLIPSEDVARYWSSRTQLMESGTHLAEWLIRHKDGHYLPVEVSGKILPDGRWEGVVRDISERKRAEEALRLSEAKFSGMVSISADAIISIDEMRRIILFNEGAEKTYGYSSAEMIGASLDVLIPERLRDTVRHHIETFAAGPNVARRMNPKGGAVYGVRRTGEEFPADATISKLSIGGKSIVTVAVRDITEQKRVESEQRLLAEVGSLLATSLDFEQTLTNVAQLIARDMADLCIIDVIEDNNKVRRAKVTCHDPSNTWICEALMRMPPEHEKLLLAGSARALKQGTLVEEVTPSILHSWAYSDEQLSALQSIEPKSVISLPLLAHGIFLGSLLLLSSTPARRYGPHELHVAEAIAQRAALSLENARLYRSANRAAQAREDVLRIVAHDLRNPLQAIASNAAHLRRSKPVPVSAAAREIGVEIGDAVKRMDRLIGDLLDVTRIETGHLSFRPTRLQASELISDFADTQMPLASSASIKLQLSIMPDLPDIWADRDRLLQVLENLVSNAIKFTKAGGCITLGAEAGAGAVVFRVADTGRGIAAGHLPHIFDLFWQTPEARRGVGLGLPIVKGIIQSHGGHVWVHSSVGHGSIFYFTIPAAAQDKSSIAN